MNYRWKKLPIVSKGGHHNTTLKWNHLSTVPYCFKTEGENWTMTTYSLILMLHTWDKDMRGVAKWSRFFRKKALLRVDWNTQWPPPPPCPLTSFKEFQLQRILVRCCGKLPSVRLTIKLRSISKWSANHFLWSSSGNLNQMLLLQHQISTSQHVIAVRSLDICPCQCVQGFTSKIINSHFM